MAIQKKRAPLAKKRGSYHHGNLREALLQAAVARIGQSQEFDFRLRDLAEDCGVRLSACYRHFAAKRDVLVELARRGFMALSEALLALDEHPTEAARALSDLGVAYITFAQANPVSYLAMFHPSLAQRSPYPELEEAALRALEPLRKAIACALGKRSAEGPAVGAAVFRAWANVHGYASLLVAREASHGAAALFGAADSERAIRDHVELFVRGLTGATG